MPALSDSVTAVSGIGAKKAALLAKLHIKTLQDALELYPRDYEDRTHLTPIAQIGQDGKYCLRATVAHPPTLSRLPRHITLVKARIFDDSGALNVVWFGQAYVASQLVTGQEYIFYGSVVWERGAPTLRSPQFVHIRPKQPYQGTMVPLYPLVAGLRQRDLLRVTDAALDAVPGDWHDPIPPALLVQCGLLGAGDALCAIHRPHTAHEVAQARRRMIFEELFLLCCGLQQLKTRRKAQSGLVFHDSNLHPFFEALPFCPTGAQQRAIAHIVADCSSGRPMNRLVQGDVGAGKTVVAAALCVLAAQNGYQAAFMAPTELLAAQHRHTLSTMLTPLGLSVVLLTGSMSSAQKRAALASIADGSAQIVVGTHALIQNNVVFHALGAVIADEQHRFGVAQRAALGAKGVLPHTLVMSATPIPRTLALIMYGDLDVTVLDELPPGRTPVATYAVGQEMRARITRFIDKQVALGGQVYVVCPTVEQGEYGLKSATEHAATLQAQLAHRRVGLLHGRMKSAEKDAVMRAFSAGALDILVATTVIEVGVDVPNACLMVVEDADRFGLSQLHQLRGRVGRGSRPSYCILFGADKGETARERLRTLCRTNDGFAVARADLAQRGPGDFFGQRQHGLPMLHIANLASDLALMQQAREQAELLLAHDPTLAQYPILQERIARMFAASSEEAFN